MRIVDGLPVDSGASDAMDSARLAGVMSTFDYPGFNKKLCLKYIIPSGRSLVAVRHPTEVPANNPDRFSRDQLMCLISGLYFAGLENIVRVLYVNCVLAKHRAQNHIEDNGSEKKWGADLLDSAAMDNLRRCSKIQSTALGRANLVIDILYASFIDPKTETNQLLCMCKVAGPKWVRFFRFCHRSLKKNIRTYWSEWRGEKDLAEHIIRVVYSL
jgi:hypothetical protein